MLRSLRPAGPIGIVAAAAFVVTGTIGVDALYALYSGRLVASSGLPHHEAFTAAAASSWVDQQWLGQWTFFEAYRFAGYGGLVLLSLGLVTTAGALLANLAARNGGNLATCWAAAATVAGVFSTAPVRVQTLTYPMFVALLWLLSTTIRRDDVDPRLLLVPPLLVLWANIHGSVLLGAGLTVACMSWLLVGFIQRRRYRRAAVALAVALASTAAVIATPYGWSVMRYYRSLMGNSALHTYISDWQPMSVARPGTWPFLLLFGAAAITLLAKPRRSRDPKWWAEVGLAVGTAGLAAYSSRYAVWAALITAYAASVHGSRPTIRFPVRPSIAAHGVAAGLLVVVAIALATTPNSSFTRLLPVHLTREAVQTLDTHPGSVLLADKSLASALLWLEPRSQQRVAFDIRYEQYRASDLLGYFRFLKGDDQAFACRYDAVAISSAERPQLVRAVRADPAWTATYDGSEGIVAVRTPGSPCSAPGTLAQPGPKKV